MTPSRTQRPNQFVSVKGVKASSFSRFYSLNSDNWFRVVFGRELDERPISQSVVLRLRVSKSPFHISFGPRSCAMALSRRHILPAIKEPQYDFEDVPRARYSGDGSACQAIERREDWISILPEMVGVALCLSVSLYICVCLYLSVSVFV
jgi:hypothetical protein